MSLTDEELRERAEKIRLRKCGCKPETGWICMVHIDIQAALRSVRDEARQEGLSAAWGTKHAEKLLNGTLHVMTCNANQSGPLGNDMCSCPPGREIKRLRHELKTARSEALEEAESAANKHCSSEFCGLKCECVGDAIRALKSKS